MQRRWVIPQGYVRNPLFAFPRNEKCPCGSEKKFKRCHLPELPDALREEDAKKARDVLVAHGLVKKLKSAQSSSAASLNVKAACDSAESALEMIATPAAGHAGVAPADSEEETRLAGTQFQEREE